MLFFCSLYCYCGDGDDGWVSGGMFLMLITSADQLSDSLTGYLALLLLASAVDVLHSIVLCWLLIRIIIKYPDLIISFVIRSHNIPFIPNQRMRVRVRIHFTVQHVFLHERIFFVTGSFSFEKRKVLIILKDDHISILYVFHKFLSLDFPYSVRYV